MINCLLIKITHNSRGQLTRSYRTLTAEEISIGRGAECTVHLPDPRLAMHHAVIKRLDDGQLHLVAVNGEIQVDGELQQNIALSDGNQMMIGPYQLTVEPAPPDVNISVSLSLTNRLPDDYQNIKSRTHEPLRGASSFKRRLSLWLSLMIALIFLALPMAQNLIPRLQNAMATLPMGFDRVWSPGNVSNAHLHFGSQCFNCHQVLTHKVSNQACLRCHRDTGPHIADTELQKRIFNTGLIFPEGPSCAQCHREHKAPHPLARQDNSMCVKCHGNIKSVDPKSTLPDIHDFDLDHPPFKLTFLTGPGKGDILRIPQSDKSRLVEYSGLKFPHSQHVGKVQGPGGIWDVRELTCTNCHRSEGKEMIFKPVSFDLDCKSCHTTQLDVGSAKATVHLPHGSEINVLNAIKVNAPKQLNQYLDTAKKEDCGYCHEIDETKKEDALPWHVVPLRINQDWFSKAHFNHNSHRTQKCQSCHDVENSDSSADVAMPDRDSCLKCHSGNNPKPKRIASSCMSCHEFHNSHLANQAMNKPEGNPNHTGH